MSVRCMLPPGWTTLRLGELFISEARAIEPSKYPGQTFELWSVPAFPTGAPEIATGKEIGSHKQRVRPGDVLLCKINPRINRVWIVGTQGDHQQIASTEWIVLRGAGVEPRFLAYQLREASFRERLCANVSGVGGSLTRARPQEVAELEVALAPLTEQQRIATHLDELLGSSRSARTKLKGIPRRLEEYRQSLFAAAFRGDLTADWRAESTDVLGGAKLLRAIRADVAEHAGQRRQEGEDDHRNADLPALPGSWAWAEAGRCAVRLTVGHVGPMQTRYVSTGVPFLRSQNVRENRIDRAGLQFIPDDFHAELNKSALSPGDLVVVRSGAPGIAAVVPPELDVANCADLVIARFSRFLDPELLAYFINSQQCRARIFERQVGVAQQHFNVGAMRTLPVPVMPMEEQHVLLNILREEDAAIARLRNRVESALAQLEMLEQSIMARAFRGDLIPQDPADEPAIMLLERIRAERAHASPTHRARRSRAGS
jgi:type I restriction enzyme, S subunit